MADPTGNQNLAGHGNAPPGEEGIIRSRKLGPRDGQLALIGSGPLRKPVCATELRDTARERAQERERELIELPSGGSLLSQLFGQ